MCVMSTILVYKYCDHKIQEIPNLFKVPLKSKCRTRYKHSTFACIFQATMNKVLNYEKICSFKHT